MVGWLGSEFHGRFFEMCIWLRYCFFELVRGRDGWLAVGGLNSATLENPKISLDNYETMDEGMGDGPRPPFRGQNLL